MAHGKTGAFIHRSKQVLLATAMLHAMPALAGEQAQGTSAPETKNLEAEFRDPPVEVRPRVWWHWVNGNITADGLVKDLQWMKRVGIGGAQAFDANLASPQIVKQRLVYMTPEWKAAFRTAAQEADRLGLELTIASSPGWSETGGPWVKPQDGMKKLVWSETPVKGGRKIAVRLPQPPDVTGPFQSIVAASGTNSQVNNSGPDLPPPFYRDAKVLAVPVIAPAALTAPVATDAAGQPVDVAPLLDNDLQTAVKLAKVKNAVTAIELTYSAPRAVRAITLFVPGAASKALGANLQATLEYQSTDGNWQRVDDVPLRRVPTTVSFDAVTARKFRVALRDVNAMPKFVPPPPGVNAMALVTGFSGSKASPGISVAELKLVGEPLIDSFEVKAGFDVVPDYYALSQGLDNVAGVKPSAVIDVTDKMRPDGTLDWLAPKGNWRILRLGYSLIGTMNHPAPIEATGLEVDKYDAGAVRRYMEHYLAMYRDTAGADMIGKNGVRAILTDSIEVGSANWTPDMIAQFTRLRGYDPTPWLPALTGTVVGSREESDRFLFDFRRTLADLLASAHYGTLAQVAHENGLKIYGEALEDHRPQIGDDMAMRSHADVPMGAMWYFPGRAVNPSYLADLKGAASVAHIYGRPRVGAESLTSMLAPWAFGPRDLKHVIDAEFASGVNLPSIHTSVHVPTEDHTPGLRISIFGQDFNRNEAWAELARPWVDYIARNSLMLQQGRNVADIAYFHGEEAPLTGLFGDSPPAGIPRTNAYDFINADALTAALANDGTDLVTQGGARYRVLYLGGTSRRMSLAVLRKLAELVEGGATVIGMRPERDPGITADTGEYAALIAKLWPGAAVARIGKGQVIATQDLSSGLQTAGVGPDFAYEAKQADGALPFVHRATAGEDIYFVVNQADHAESIEARFRVTGKAPELWHAETGTFEPVSYRIEGSQTVVPLTLQQDESVHVVFRKPAQGTGVTVNKPQPSELATLQGPWKVAFQPGRGAPAQAQLPALAPLNENADPAIKYFSGIATYNRDFKAPRGWKPGKPLLLDLGEAYEIAEVTVNGKLAGYAWHKPYLVDIGAVAKPGTNRLQVRVANLWVNRLTGDAQPNAQKVTWTANPPYVKSAPLRPSGLIGPVRLMGEGK